MGSADVHVYCTKKKTTQLYDKQKGKDVRISIGEGDFAKKDRLQGRLFRDFRWAFNRNMYSNHCCRKDSIEFPLSINMLYKS